MTCLDNIPQQNGFCVSIVQATVVMIGCAINTKNRLFFIKKFFFFKILVVIEKTNNDDGVVDEETFRGIWCRFFGIECFFTMFIISFEWRVWENTQIDNRKWPTSSSAQMGFHDVWVKFLWFSLFCTKIFLLVIQYTYITQLIEFITEMLIKCNVVEKNK